jgi:uncharacterized protein involved in exopolysaccharide biosynthesis
MATPVYRAEVVITPVRATNAASGASALASQLGGLASLNLTPTSSEIQTSEAILASHRLAEEFIKRNRLEGELDRKTNGQPSLWSAVRRFKEQVLTIRKDSRNGVTTVAVEWTNPETVASWANGFVALANELVRTRVLNESTRNISYINSQIEQTNVLELRQVMYDIVESEMKTQMLANGRIEYAFQVVDPAVAPELRVRPRRTLMVSGGLLVGLLIGSVCALLIERFGRREAQRSSVSHDKAATEPTL